MADLFDGNTQTGVDPTKNYLDELVGDGKKFKTQEDLARGKAEADRHIEHLTNTLNELRDELKTRKTTEDLMDRINALSNRPNDPPARTEPQNDPNTAAGLKAEDVERMFSERENVARQNNNLQAAQAKLVERYGDATATEIEKKAAELGVSREHLRDMAKNTPQVFLALFTAPAPVRDVFNAPASGSNRSQLPNGALSGTRKFSEFQKIRRENPTEYFGAKVQKEILAIADRLGGPGNPAYEAWRNS